MENIDKVVDTLLSTGKLVSNPKRKIRSKKLIALAVVCVAFIGLSVTGALIYLFSQYGITTEGDIDLEGLAPYLEYDGIPLLEEYTVTDMDVTYLNAGDSFEFEHSVEALTDAGDWDVYFDTSDIETNEELLEFIGFYFTVEDDSDNEISYVEVFEGTSVSFFYDYTLDPNFADTLEDFPFLLTLDIVSYVPAPEANDNSYTRDWGVEVLNEQICTNDVIYRDGASIEIVDVFNEYHVTITNINTNKVSYIIDEGESEASFEYMITDGFKTDTALVTLTGVPPS